MVVADKVAGAALGVWLSSGISGGHINPVVRLCPCGAYLRKLADMIRAGDYLFSYLPSIPMEESAAVHSRSGLGRVLW